MAVDLGDFVDTLRREVTPLGGVSIGDDDTLLGYLSDAFWEARLDGFFAGYACDEDGEITPIGSGSDEFPRQFTAMVVLYAGIRILRNQVLNTKTQFSAKAGPVEFQQQSSAHMLAEMLKQLQATKERLIEQIRYLTPTYAFDALSTRMFSLQAYFGSIELT